MRWTATIFEAVTGASQRASTAATVAPVVGDDVVPLEATPDGLAVDLDPDPLHRRSLRGKPHVD